MKISKFLSAALIMAVGLLPVASWAENRSGAFTLSPMAGGIVMEGDQNVDDDFAYSFGIGYNFTKAFALEAVLTYAELEEDGTNNDVDFWNYRIDALYHFMTDRSLVPYVALGAGVYDLDSDKEFMANYGLGLLYYFTDDVALRADVRHLAAFNESNLENNLLYTAGLKVQFGGREEAPAPVAVAAAAVAAPAPIDSDGDGVTDDLDQCPDTPKGVKVDARGCPLDSDGDGVTDDLDQCPDTPKGVKVDAKGCPLDSDGDGVTDDRDQCPDTPKGVKVDDKGCPLDGDGDGVADDIDQCPNTPEGIVVDEKGCELKLTLRINFDFDKAVIKPEFKSELDKAAEFVRENSQAPYILIAGNTDSMGNEEYNQNLSEQRAEAVRQALIRDYGLDGSKLKAVGYGEYQPVAENATEEGRARNRRVELVCCALIPE